MPLLCIRHRSQCSVNQTGHGSRALRACVPVTSLPVPCTEEAARSSLKRLGSRARAELQSSCSVFYSCQETIGHLTLFQNRNQQYSRGVTKKKKKKKESTCQCRGHGFEPWPGKIPHAAEQLRPCATTAEPALYSPRATTIEAHMPQLLNPACLEPVLCNEKPPQ